MSDNKVGVKKLIMEFDKVSKDLMTSEVLLKLDNTEVFDEATKIVLISATDATMKFNLACKLMAESVELFEKVGVLDREA